MTIATETKAITSFKHEFAEVIHRLEAGGAMLPDTENLMQIIGIYKAYAVPMDFYSTYFILPSVSLDPFPFFKYLTLKSICA